MRLIEEANPKPQLEAPPATGNLHRILVIDAMAVVQGNYNNNNNNNNDNNNNDDGDDDDDDDDDVIFCVYDLYARLKKQARPSSFQTFKYPL